MASLFDLAGEYKELYAMLTEAEEDEQQTVEDTLEAVIGEIEVKAEGYVCLLNRLDMELSACKKHRDEWYPAVDLAFCVKQWYHYRIVCR